MRAPQSDWYIHSCVLGFRMGGNKAMLSQTQRWEVCVSVRFTWAPPSPDSQCRLPLAEVKSWEHQAPKQWSLARCGRTTRFPGQQGCRRSKDVLLPQLWPVLDKVLDRSLSSDPLTPEQMRNKRGNNCFISKKIHFYQMYLTPRMLIYLLEVHA